MPGAVRTLVGSPFHKYVHPMIELEGVAKVYHGPWYRTGSPVHALDGVTLKIDPGESVGIVGLNGAGKSTLLRILMGFIRPTTGVARIDGLPPRGYVERSGIAYVPERVSIPRHWTVRRAARAYAMLGDLRGDAWEQVEHAIERLGLQTLTGRRVGTLSKGNLQRLGVAQALLGDRSIMVLDEPTDGLDPVWIAELRTIVNDWRAQRPDRIVVLASHNLPEVEKLADRTVLLHNGRLDGEIERNRDSRTLEHAFLERVKGLEEARP